MMSMSCVDVAAPWRRAPTPTTMRNATSASERSRRYPISWNSATASVGQRPRGEKEVGLGLELTKALLDWLRNDHLCDRAQLGISVERIPVVCRVLVARHCGSAFNLLCA